MRHTLLALLLLPFAALAHTGADAGAHHGTAFVASLLHPFTGIDHLAAMLAVGFWSALVFHGSPRALWAAPAAFAALLVAGAVAGFAGHTLPQVEPMVAASLLVLGVLVATQARLHPAVGAALVGFFAVFHGLAHGAELPAQQALAALAGMLLGTVALHLAGMALGRLVAGRAVWLPRLAGTGVALLGAGLLAGAV